MKRSVIVSIMAFVVVLSMAAPVMLASTATASPSGFVNLGSDQVSHSIPDEVNDKIPVSNTEIEQRSEGNIMASGYAHTTDANWVVVNEKSGAIVDQNAANAIEQSNSDPPLEVAIQVSDGVNHDARQVTVPASLIEELYGFQPEMAYGTHEDGSEWTAPITYEDGLAVFEVPKFSTNTISFDGEITINAQPSVDGDQFTYNISDSSGASDPNVTLTGVQNTETENKSSSSLTNGDTLSISVAGNAEPIGPDGSGDPEVTFTGVETSSSDSSSGTAYSSGDTEPLSIDGNLDPTDESVSVTGSAYTGDYLWPECGTNSFRLIDQWDSATRTVDVSNLDTLGAAKITFYTLGYGTEIYVEADGTSMGTYTGNGNSGEETYVHDGTNIDVSGKSTVDLFIRKEDSDGSIRWEDECDGGGTDNVKMWGASPEPSSITVDANGGGSSESLGSGGSTSNIDFTSDTSSMDVTFNGGGRVDWDASWTEASQTEDPSLSDGGTTVASHTGMLTDGETVTISAPDLSTSTDSLDVSTVTGSNVGASVDYTEVTETADPTVEINGQTVSHSGSLADGETVTKTGNSSWIQDGENQVNVSVGDGTLSADAPSPSVGLDYSHDSPEEQSVNYQGESFSERYNVSKTWSGDRDNAELVIPWASSSVVEVRDVEAYRDGSQVSDPSYTVESDRVVVDLGTVSAGEETRVVANGSKVKVNNGDIKVLEPTTTGNSLDSKIEITTKNSGFGIDVGGRDNGDYIHYTHSESWTGADEYAVVTSGGKNTIYVPNADSGSTTRISTIPVRASPAVGNVRVSADGPQAEEPEFHVEPGPTSGDEVDFTFVDAKDNEDYILYSNTNDVVRDSGTANSPITLTDDDSSETLQFQLDDGGNGSSGGGGGGGGIPPLDPSGGGGFDFGGIAIIGIAGLGLLAGAIMIRRFWGDDPRDQVAASASTGQRSSGGGGVVGSVVGVFKRIGSLLVGIAKAFLVALASATFLVGRKGGSVGKSIAGSRMGLFATAAASVVALFAFDVISLTAEERVLILVVGVMLGTFLFLNRVDRFNWPLYGGISTAAFILGLNMLGTDLFTAFINSPVFPLLGAGLLFLAYRWMQAYRQGQQTVVQISPDDDDD